MFLDPLGILSAVVKTVEGSNYPPALLCGNHLASAQGLFTAQAGIKCLDNSGPLDCGARFSAVVLLGPVRR